MRHQTLIGCLLLLTLSTAADAIRLEVHPSVLMHGASVRLTCRVPPYSENRWVRFGFENYLADERQLDGASARITWEAQFDHLPCDSGEAFCEVVRSDHSVARVTRHVEIADCE